MTEEEARRELHKSYASLREKGLFQSLETYIQEHVAKISEISAGIWDEERAKDYIGKLRAASADIDSEMEAAS